MVAEVTAASITKGVYIYIYISYGSHDPSAGP